MDKDDFKAILLSVVAAPPVLLALWWMYNFAVYVADGTSIPMWREFNSWACGLFA